MRDAGLTGIGIEPNARMAENAACELGLDVRRTTLEKYAEAGVFDAISLLQVVDHLDDVRAAFEQVRRVTRPGSWCLVEFGNRSSFTARLLGPAWHEYAPPSVRRVFSLRALRRVLGNCGFALHSWGHAQKYLRADHALALLEYKAGPWLGRNVVARAAQLVPSDMKLRYPADDIIWALFERG